jgi:hypothetical protein
LRFLLLPRQGGKLIMSKPCQIYGLAHARTSPHAFAGYARFSGLSLNDNGRPWTDTPLLGSGKPDYKAIAELALQAEPVVANLAV